MLIQFKSATYSQHKYAIWQGLHFDLELVFEQKTTEYFCGITILFVLFDDRVHEWIQGKILEAGEGFCENIWFNGGVMVIQLCCFYQRGVRVITSNAPTPPHPIISDSGGDQAQH